MMSFSKGMFLYLEVVNNHNQGLTEQAKQAELMGS